MTIDLTNTIIIKFDLDVTPANLQEFHEWLDTIPTGRWFVSFGEIYFEKSEDATLFKLRWG